jgi:hypothetical protein
MPKFHRLTAKQVAEAEDLMAQLDERADRERRRFTKEETRAWQEAHDMVVADTMLKAGLKPAGKLPSYVWDWDSEMWRPDTEGVNHFGPDHPVQYEIDGREPPRGFLVPPRRK